MTKSRTSMNKIRKVLKLSNEGQFSLRDIASLSGVSKSTISHYIKLFQEISLTFEEAEKLSDSQLQKRLLKTQEKAPPELLKLRSLFPEYQLRLSKKGVTKQRLWKEYLQHFPEGYKYSRFCYHFQIYSESLEVRMHQNHTPGDKAFIDYTGEKFPLIDPVSGKVKKYEVFLAILGASQLLYAEACESQKKEEFIRSCERALHYFGGAPRALVPDNLKSAVTKADRYEPELNPLFDDFAEYYRMAIIPARARKPRDKALVENAVTLVYQRIFAPLYDKTFYSLKDLNRSFREQLEIHNNRKITRLGISRRELFEKVERECLIPLPTGLYPLKYFETHKIAPDYHFILSVDKHYYSVPWQLKGTQVRVVFDDRNVAVYADGLRVTQHRRNRITGGYTTEASHMPPHHRFVNSWSAGKFEKWAAAIGKETLMVIKQILSSKRHEEQAYKSCMGVLSLAKKHSQQELNQACRMALNYQRVNSREVRKYLQEIKRRKNEDQDDAQMLLFTQEHENIRGKSQYQ